jgi:ACS family hexuronate transporter-like MFS transporter
MLNGALLTLCSDAFDTATVGTASGMAGSIAWIGGMIFTLIIGQSVDFLVYNPLFVALGLLDLIGAGILWILLRPPGPSLTA